MHSEKKKSVKVRYTPNKDVSTNKEPHPENKKQEKEYREQKNKSDK